MTGEVVKKGRGGYRVGAGRKTKDGIKGVGTITLTMDEITEAIAHELGEGDYGVGVRRAMKELSELRKKAKGITPARPTANAPTARKSILRSPTKEDDSEPRPLLRGQIRDWD